MTPMQKAAAALTGTHDFAAFRSTGSSIQGTVRTITRSSVTREGELVYYDVCGSGFLYNMVRIIAGTLIEIGLHRRSADAFTEAFRTLDRLSLGVTAPPHGLELTKVYYPEEAFRMPEAVRWHEE